MASMDELLVDSEAIVKWICPPLYLLLKRLVEAVEPEDTDATIRKLREEHDQATGERENLLESCRWWKQRWMNAEHELAEAKAEIERLRPLAEIGRLVRGMHKGSRLQRATLGSYAGLRFCAGGWDFAEGKSILYSDPAEALRGIQEGGDGELP